MELIYARWLGQGTRFALTVLVATFLAYALGLMEPLVSLQRLPALWGLPLADFLAATGAPTGWAWLRFAAQADYANHIGVAMLGVVSVVCYVRILPTLFRSRERALGVLALLQVLVLLIAASGLLAAGH